MLSQRQFRIARDIIQRRISEGWSDRKGRLFFNVYYIGRLMNLILYSAMKLTQFFKRGDRPSGFLFIAISSLPLPPLSFDGTARRNVVCSKIYFMENFCELKYEMYFSYFYINLFPRSIHVFFSTKR